MSRVTRSSTCCSMPAAAHLFIYFLAVYYIYTKRTSHYSLLRDSAKIYCNSARRHNFSRYLHTSSLIAAWIAIIKGTSGICHCLLRKATPSSNSASRSCIALLHEPFISNPALSGCVIRSASGHRSCTADPALPRCDPRTTAISPWCVVKEKDRDWGLNRGLSGSVPHKNTINNINHPATQIRSAACWTKGRVSLNCQPRVTGH